MKNYERHLGPVAQKVLLLLMGGVSLGLTITPSGYFKVLNEISKEWREINKRSLSKAIRNLYSSKMLDYEENKDGTVSVITTEKGKKRALTYNLENIKIKNPKKWDSFWRIVVFDIPEFKKSGRNALAAKLKQMQFYPMQKSIFVHPFPCEDEISFISEIFELKPYVRMIIAKQIDIDIHLRRIFKNII